MDGIVYVLLEVLTSIPGWLGTLFVALCVYGAYQWLLEGLFNDDSSRKR